MTSIGPGPMGQYISLPVTTDAYTLTQQALTNIAAAIPGWVARESAPEVILVEQFAAMCAEAAQVAANVPMTIFAYFGTLVGISPIPGAAATVETTWNLIDAAGYTIHAGTQVAFPVNGSQSAVFVTTLPTQVAPGETSANIVVQAVGAGTAYNGIAPGPMQLVSPLTFITSVVSTSTVSGGADPETLSAYLNRLSSELQFLAPRPILPADYAGIATNVPGVYRAFAVGGLSPGRSFTGATLVNGSATLTSVDANFTAYDLGRTVSDSAGAIPAGVTIASIPNTTVASGSNGAVLPVSVLYLESISPSWPTSGTVTIQLDANTSTTVTYAGVSGNTLTGCTGGTGILATGMAAYCGSQCTLSSVATSSESDDTITLGDLSGQERTVAISAVDVDGNTLSPTDVAALRTYLLARREVNFVVNFLAPTYSPINVTYQVVSSPGYNTENVLTNITATLTTMLSQATWAGGSLNPPIWDSTATVVRYNAVLAAIGSVAGVQYVKALDIGIAGQPVQQSDIYLPGDAPLTQVGALIGSITQGT